MFVCVFRLVHTGTQAQQPFYRDFTGRLSLRLRLTTMIQVPLAVQLVVLVLRFGVLRVLLAYHQQCQYYYY